MTHRAHDYPHLLARWRALAERSGLRLATLARADGYRVVHLASPALQREGGIYISAGIHGDEAGATEGLIAWAEKHARRLARLPVILFPCLNPWGLRHNLRLDASGRDLNRVFHLDDAPAIAALKRRIAGYRFRLALTLHEDYDAQGAYLYEIQGEKPFWGEHLLAAISRTIAHDPRTKIDGRRARSGVIRRRINPRYFTRIGYPESVYLHENHAQRALTIETPSEFALDQRTAAQVAIIEECVRRGLEAG